MKSKVIAMLIIMVMVCAIISGCSTVGYNPSSDDPTANLNTTPPGVAEESNAKDSSIIPVSFEDLESGTDGIGKKDLESSWDISESTLITLNGTTATVSGEGATVSGSTVTITMAGTYVVSGTLSKGQIVINATKDDNVRLVLNGVDITADKNAAIYAATANKLIVILADGTTNKLTDGSSYAYADTEKEEPDGTLFAKCDLTINGTGTLVVNGNYQNAIRTKDDLVIISGTFVINAVNNGLHAKDSVLIVDGKFNIASGNDGIKSSSDEKKGWVEIRGGEFSISAEYDGIQAETELLITGGDFSIISGGGSAKAPVRSGGFGGMGGMRPGSSSQQTTTNEESESKKGLKAKNIVYIADGTFTIDAYDDAVHSNNEIIIAGGNFEIKTGDDGIHADVSVLIAGGDINIVQNYEGIEGLTVTITGGNISVVASDDGINISNGEGKALNGGRPTTGVNKDAYVKITGGTVDVWGGTDGIDSNGHIYIEGGIITISGPSQTMEGAIDKDGNLTITGGEIITAGTWDSTPSSSTQPSILLSYSKTHSAGSVITVKDADGNTLLEYTSKTDFSASGFSSPNFEIGKTYTIYINNEKICDIKISNNNTTISDTGGAYSAGRGGPGGSGNMPSRRR